MSARSDGAGLGAGLAVTPVAVGLAWACVVNPWFLDAPVVMGGALALAAGLGAVVGAIVGRGRGGGWLLSSAFAILTAAWFRPAPGQANPDVLVFGIDGAGWRLVDQLDMPTLAAMRQRGASGELRSEEPTFSPLLWTTMATGERPEAHGIHGFRTRSDHTKAARFWQIAGESGRSVGIYKWLVTWPPEPQAAGGFMVPAWLAPEPDTWPDALSFVKEIELSRRLKRRKMETPVRPSWRLALAGIPEGLRLSTLWSAASWAVHERVSHPSPEERSWRLQLLRVQIDRDVFLARLLRDQPDLATFTTYATDALGHTHWGLMASCRGLGSAAPVPASESPCPAWADAVPDAYEQADAVLADILAVIGPDTHVFVVSDHGFRAMDPSDAGRYFAPTTERLRLRVSEEVSAVDVARLGHKVVISLLAEDAQAQRVAVEAWLADLTQASTGEPFYRWEPLPDDARAIGLTLRSERVDDARLATDTVGGEPIGEYVKRTEAYTGEHDLAGIYALIGPQIPAGVVRDADLIDVAPTVLTLLGLPAGEDMPGHALFGAPLPRVPTYDALAPAAGADVPADVNTEQLRALGYIE